MTKIDSADYRKCETENGEWDFDMCEQLCKDAGLEEEWHAADGESFENVIFKAAEILGVDLY